jgi:hypothetical protein
VWVTGSGKPGDDTLYMFCEYSCTRNHSSAAGRAFNG